MEKQEIIKIIDEQLKKEYILEINDNTLKIEINNNEIIFILMIGISYYKYIKKYKYDEIIKELDLSEYKDLKKVYNYLIKSEYRIINEDKIKKIVVNNKEIKLNEKILKNEEIIKILIDEVNKQKEKINELMKRNEEKDNKINKLEDKYNELKGQIYELDDNIKDKYRDEINIIYKTDKEGNYNIFGEEFDEKNKDNIELNINGMKNNLINKYDLKKGDNNIKIKIKK